MEEKLRFGCRSVPQNHTHSTYCVEIHRIRILAILLVFNRNLRVRRPSNIDSSRNPVIGVALSGPVGVRELPVREFQVDPRKHGGPSRVVARAGGGVRLERNGSPLELLAAVDGQTRPADVSEGGVVVVGVAAGADELDLAVEDLAGADLHGGGEERVVPVEVPARQRPVGASTRCRAAPLEDGLHDRVKGRGLDRVEEEECLPVVGGGHGRHGPRCLERADRGAGVQPRRVGDPACLLRGYCRAGRCGGLGRDVHDGARGIENMDGVRDVHNTAALGDLYSI
ncbi:hypothetical protein B0H12DRAFT_1164141 [Mycena haematopus]|nr:hypothetical protein B0H12DRAFT_1164141 [Mycena haematopus]